MSNLAELCLRYLDLKSKVELNVPYSKKYQPSIYLKYWKILLRIRIRARRDLNEKGEKAFFRGLWLIKAKLVVE